MTIRIILSPDELKALEKLAWRERRRVNQQAALLIREKLIECGLLSASASTPDALHLVEAPAVAHDRQ